MSQIPQGRAKAKRVFRKPKDFRKAQKQANEVFDTTENRTGAANREYAPKFSRVTHQLVKRKKSA